MRDHPSSEIRGTEGTRITLISSLMNIYTVGRRRTIFRRSIMPPVVVNPEGYVGSCLDLGSRAEKASPEQNAPEPNPYFTNRRFWQRYTRGCACKNALMYSAPAAGAIMHPRIARRLNKFRIIARPGIRGALKCEIFSPVREPSDRFAFTGNLSGDV